MNESAAFTGAFRNLGAALPFSAEADFTGVYEAADITLGNIAHTSRLSIDAQGTEAYMGADVTLPEIEPAWPIVRVDHPFVFAIYEQASGVIIYLGRIESPHPDGTVRARP